MEQCEKGLRKKSPGPDDTHLKVLKEKKGLKCGDTTTFSSNYP